MSGQSQDFSLHHLYRKADKVLLPIVWFHLLVCIGLAGWYDTWNAVWMIGVPAALVPTLLVKAMPGQLLTRMSIALSFMVFSALAIHQSHGMLELHFGIFTLLAFLLFYRDWITIVAAAAAIAVHHVAFFVLQASAYPVYVFQEANDFNIVLIHAAYVVIESAVLIYMSVIGHKDRFQAQEIFEIGTQLSKAGDTIDLTYRKPDAKSEFAIGFNRFMDTVHELVKNTASSASRVSSAAAQLGQVSEETVNGVLRQKRETDQMVTAINEMTLTTEQVSMNAANAAQAADSASSDAERGLGIVNRTIDVISAVDTDVRNAAEVISQLENASVQIGDVMVVIKGIAEQTNLLALNAAIEAARAGEQGRGFAVVADEVRNLASRTQESTREIEGMIERLQQGSKNAVEAMEKSRERSAEGVQQASEAGQALQSIAAAIISINDMNQQIAAAVEEQTAVSGNINQNVQLIGDIAEKTSSGASLTASSTDELASLAAQLEGLVRHFKV